jgi:serine/threonine-protein kinase
VAVKALINTGEFDTSLARFRNEAVIQYSLRHQNVAELYEYFEYQGKPCIVMEFVEGRSLNEWIRDNGALEPESALAILADICDAVSYMHSKGTIHRDIKSENIRITGQGVAKLLDFGIAVSKKTPALTRVGCAIGTPAKMAPEQHRGLRGDSRSDVWALGVLLYEMVTGFLPFVETSDIMALRYTHAVRRKPGLPKPIGKLISNCLRLNPAERYASGGVMLREVQQVRRRLASEKWKQALLSRTALAAAAVFLFAILAAWYALSGEAGGKDAASEVRTAEKAPAQADDSVNRAPGRPGAGVASAGGRSTLPARTDPPATPAREPSPPGESNPGDQRTVRVATYDGPAELTNKEGQVLGTTPFLLTGPVGKNFELWLRRPGFQPRLVDVQLNNKSEYLFGLDKIEGRSEFGKKE